MASNPGQYRFTMAQGVIYYRIWGPFLVGVAPLVALFFAGLVMVGPFGLQEIRCGHEVIDGGLAMHGGWQTIAKHEFEHVSNMLNVFNFLWVVF